MGLLTSPSSRQKLTTIISRYSIQLALLFYLAGVGWFLALAHKPLNNGVYFSENALLPGLVTGDYTQDYGESDFLRDLRTHMKNLKSVKDNPDLQYQLPVSFFTEKFRSLGLETHVQNFSFKYPVGILKDQVFQGQNFYAILRAPKTASTEAIVISVPYRTSSTVYGQTNPGIALMYGLAKSSRRYTYWAKDIIFLVTEHEQFGMQAWLSGYHYSSSEYIQAGELPARCGSIQAALNLEIGTSSVSNINVKLEGLNGQLPNLDLVNTVNRLCRQEGMTPMLQKQTDTHYPEEFEGFQHSLKTMFKMMWNQASGIPTGNHGLFHRYHIEAVTLQGVKLKGHVSYGYNRMGSLVKGVMRSLNNLLERFHQSFFFYLLPSTERYVSIGLYMPPFGLLILAALIRIALWISGLRDEEEKKKAEEEKETTETTETENDEDMVELLPPPSGLISTFPVLIMCMFFGLAAYSGPLYAVETSAPFRMRPAEGILWGFIALQLSGMMFPKMLTKKSSNAGEPGNGVDWKTLKCVALLAEGLVIGCVGMMNISLAFFIGVVWVPVTLLVGPSHRRIWNWIQYILLLVISPLGLLFFGCVVQHYMDKPSTDVVVALQESYQTLLSALLTAVIDHYMIGSWSFILASSIVFPNWLMFWALLWTGPSPPTTSP